jgi:hypothetical protein
VESATLTDWTKIQNNGLKFKGTPAAKLYVQFTLPFARIFGSTDGTTYSTFNNETITIESSDGATFKTVTIDGISGQIGQ